MLLWPIQIRPCIVRLKILFVAIITSVNIELTIVIIVVIINTIGKNGLTTVQDVIVTVPPMWQIFTSTLKLSTDDT